MGLAEGSINQSDINGGGQQCTCIAVTFLCLNSEQIINTKECCDDNKVGHDATELFKSHIVDHYDGKSKYLFIDDLPEFITVHNQRFHLKRSRLLQGLIDEKELNTAFLTTTVRDACKQAFTDFSVCLITVGKIMDIHSRFGSHLKREIAFGALTPTVVDP